MKSETDNKQPNWFVRILIVLLCIFLCVLICYNFFWSSPPAQISSGLLALIAFLTVLVLSEAFDNFSITKLMTLSRTVKDKENRNQELSEENINLRNHIISITSNINQRQNNSMNIGIGTNSITVEQADEPEKEEEKRRIEIEEAPETEKFETKKSVSYRELEKVALPKFLQDEKLTNYPLINDVKFVHFQQVDPINEYSPIFDGYILKDDTQIFIEMKSRRLAMISRERIYLMLSKIYHYKRVENVNAFLFLVFVASPDESTQNYISKSFERMVQEFEPAIKNGLLKLRKVEITQEEIDALEIE